MWHAQNIPVGQFNTNPELVADDPATYGVKGKEEETSGYATWFTAGGAICIAHYDVITRKL